MESSAKREGETSQKKQDVRVSSFLAFRFVLAKREVFCGAVERGVLGKCGGGVPFPWEFPKVSEMHRSFPLDSKLLLLRPLQCLTNCVLRPPYISDTWTKSTVL